MGTLVTVSTIKSDVRQGCILASNCFDGARDWVFDRSTHRAMHGATLGPETLIDFDSADDVTLLFELLNLLLSALEMFAEEELTVNRKKTKIQSLSDFLPSVPDLSL